MSLHGETFIHTYCFPPGTKVKGPAGGGILIGVMRLWFRDVTTYCVLLDSDGVTTMWASEPELCGEVEGSPWEILEVPERAETAPGD